MKNYCVIAPSKGAQQFYQLKKQLGRKLAESLWNDIISHLDFLKDYKATLTLDSEGMPTFDSIMTNPVVQNYIGKENVRKSLEAQYLTREDSPKNYELALNDALTFNQSNPNNANYVAVVDKLEDKIKVSIVDKTPLNLEKFKNLFGIVNLNNSITNILASIGITPALIEKSGINGITDFSKALKLAEDLILVSIGLQGDIALSEEFSHLCLEVFKDNPLIERIKRTIADELAIREILGDLYENYAEMYDLDANKMIDEAMGHMLLDSFFKANNVPEKSLTLFLRLVSLIKNLFRKLNSSDLLNAILDSRTAMDKVAKDILGGNLKLTLENIRAINRSDILYSLELTNKAIKILSEGTDRELKMAKISRNEDTSFIDQMVEFLLNDLDTALGICRYIQHSIKELESLNNDFHLAYETQTNIKFGYLRRVNNYINMYSPILLNLQRLLIESENDDDLLLLSRTFLIKGVSEQTILDLVDQANRLINRLTGRYNVVATKAFAAFLEPFIGSNIANPFKNGEKLMSVEEMIKKAPSDISFMDKWLSAMSESSDTLLQLFDLATKKAKDAARMETINMSKQILSAYLKAKNAGVTDFSFMYHYDSNGNRTDSYINSLAAEGLSKAQKEFYDTFMEIKAKLDDKIDDSQADLLHVILIKKEHSFGALGLLALGKFNEVGEYLKNLVFERDYDDLQGFGVRQTLKGFSGEEYMLVPKYYLHNLKDQNEVSDDPMSSLIAYAFMANNYKEMDNIVDALETGRNILRDRKVSETRGDKFVKEKLQWAGFDMEADVEKEWSKTNIAQKLDKFFNSQVYGRYIEDEGVWHIMGKDISKQKLTSTILAASSHVQLGFNWLANSANIANGIAITNIETAASKYVKPKFLALADKIYASLIGEYIAELSNPIKKSKLALIGEYFDTKLTYNEHIKTRYDLNLLTKIFGPNIAFVGLEMGDHWLYNRVAIAMLLDTKVKDDKGNETSLYDALEVITDENGVAKLQFKKGYDLSLLNLKAGLNVFTTVGRRIASVTQKLFGIYNQDDLVAAQQVCIGRLALQYRKWMMPALAKRFLASLYNTTMDLWEEGYYRTTGKFLVGLYRDLRRGQFLFGAAWDNLTDELKSNINLAITEVCQYLVVLGAISLLSWGWKDKERPWLVKFLDYLLRRQKTELGVLIPSHYMLAEGLKVINSPAAGLSTINNALSLVLAVYDPIGNERKSGPYKGMTNIEKAIYINTPYIKSIHRFTDDIDTAINYFNL